MHVISHKNINMFSFEDEVVVPSVEEETAVEETTEDATEVVADEGNEVAVEETPATEEAPSEDPA